MKKTMTLLALLLGLVFTVSEAATVSITRPQQIDLSSSSSESAIKVTLAGYTSNDARYKIFNGATPFYYCWNPSTDQFVTSNSYANGPQVLGTPTTTTTFWIPFQIGTNNSTVGKYRDKLGAAYTADYQTVTLPSAVSIVNPKTLTKSSVTFSTWSYYAEKHVILGFDANNNFISATSTALNTGNFSLVYESSTVLSKIEVRTLTNNLIETVSLIPTTLSGTYTVGTSGNYATLPLAIADLTTKGVSGAVTFNLTDATYNLGTTPLTIGAIAGTDATKTVTIKPATGVTTSITGNVAGALISLNGADYLTINGANAVTIPTPKTLTIANTNTAGTDVGLANTSENCTITNCIITGGASTGIEVLDAPNASITKNRIYNLTGSGSNAVTGIYYVGKTSAMSAAVSNNMITLLPSTTKEIAGIRYEGNVLNSLDLYHNSIFIGGLQSATDNSYAFLKGTAITTLNAKNNIFYNARTNVAKAGSGKHYSVSMINTENTSMDQNYNLLYSITGNLGHFGFMDYTNWSQWAQNSAQDYNSKSSALTFVDSLNGNISYRRNVVNVDVYNTGADVGITTDFYGTARPQYGLYDIGAYELPQSSDLSETSLPTVNTLAQNYPNPFNPETTIGFTLAKNATVNLTVYNTKGEVVKALINNNLNAGFHSVNFNAVGLNSGVYVYKLTTPDNSITKKMILLK